MNNKEELKEYNKKLCKTLRLLEDFLDLDAAHNMYIYLKLMRRIYGGLDDEEKLKEQVLNELQSLGSKTSKENK